MQNVAEDFRCGDCGNICITSVHYNLCCIDRKEEKPCKLCIAYNNNTSIHFKEKIPTGDKEIDFIIKSKLNKVYNYEYLQRIDKVTMEISPDSAFEIIKSIDKVEKSIKDNDSLIQLRANLCFVLQVDEDDISDLSYQDYIVLKLEEIE